MRMENYPRVVLHNASADDWQELSAPVEIVQTHRHDEVMDCLRHVERQVESRGLHAAGFVGYEAAPAFDRALLVRQLSGFPLLWFGLFPAVRTFAFPPHKPAPLAPDIPWRPSVTAGEYAAAITRLRNAIAAGETYQVNYTFRLKQPASGDPWDLFQNLVAAQRPPYAAYLETERFAICSASPELFFELEGQRIASRPMKGTIARGRWHEEDLARAGELAASEKNRAENTMIVDMMRNDLGRIARAGSVQVSELFRVERYPTLWQMTSRVSAETGAGLAEIFAAMFPCASITGAPKANTMRIIAESETEPRRIYTGSIGWFGPGRRARFNVAIRTVLIDKVQREAEYGVGGGVVWDSTPQNEYDECLLKSKILTVRRPEFSLLETLRWTPDGGYACWSEHLRRLRESAEYFDFPRSDENAANRLTDLAASLPPAPHKIRLLVARDGTITCQSEPIRDEDCPDPIRLELAAEPIDAADVFLYHKTTHRAVYAAARDACSEGDDVLLFNQQGEITETLRGNIVVRCGQDLWTPPVSCGLLAGTYRAQLLAAGKIGQRVIRLEMLPECDELFFINSVRLWRNVRLVGPRNPRALAARFQAKVR
jgi:para-aminobenzoate synthetase / 4-amino-4-deoxychorismate lyase